jgi:hypothetical protein
VLVLITRYVNAFYFNRFLTSRQQELHRRRIRAEKVLEWKLWLDQEEKEVEQLEAEVASFSSSLPPELCDASRLSGSELSFQFLSSFVLGRQVVLCRFWIFTRISVYQENRLLGYGIGQMSLTLSSNFQFLVAMLHKCCNAGNMTDNGLMPWIILC